jgi:hypothetical protein
MTKTTFINLNNGVMNSYPGHKLTGKQRYKKLYHFTSFETFVRIWSLKELKFGKVSNVNDIQESLKEVRVSFNQLSLMCAYQDILSSYKQISFTMDNDSYLQGYMNTMMWGYYGDKSHGVCLEFDFDKLTFPNGTFKGIVRYTKFPNRITEFPADIKTIRDVKCFISKNAKKLFFSKQIGWKEENEFRVLNNSLDYLNIGDAITCVYLTSCESKECQMVEQLVNNVIAVKFLSYYGDLPIASNTKRERDKLVKAKMDKNNVLNSFYQQARRHYEKHKYDDNISLLLDRYEINN